MNIARIRSSIALATAGRAQQQQQPHTVSTDAAGGVRDAEEGEPPEVRLVTIGYSNAEKVGLLLTYVDGESVDWDYLPAHFDDCHIPSEYVPGLCDDECPQSFTVGLYDQA